jgi:5,10-methylenetetrahydromethanopterin reductase
MLAGTRPEANAALVSRAEEAGLDTISVGEAGFDSFAGATAVALWSRRVRVYSGVVTWARPPVLAATSAATVDLIARGRYVLGLGTMPPPWNRDYYGIDPARPVTRMAEYVEVVRSALRAHDGRSCDYEGEFFAVREYRKPQPPLRDDLPIHLAATLPGMAALAGRVADGVLFNLLHTVSWLRDNLVPAVTAAGRSIERGVMVRCAVGEEEQALGRVRDSLRPYLHVPYFYRVAESAGFDLGRVRALAGLGDVAGALAAVPATYLREMALVGSPAEVVATARRYEDLVDWVLLAPVSAVPGTVIVEQSEAIIDVFGAGRG